MFKKLLLIVLISLTFYFFYLSPVLAENNHLTRTSSSPSITLTRAGGGSSSGGSSSGSSSGSTHSHHTRGYSSYGYSSIVSQIIWLIATLLLASVSLITFQIKLKKSARISKKIMKLLTDKDQAWKYKNIAQQVTKTYYIIQKSWSALDMTPAKDYMDQDLYEQFQVKLNWMQLKNEQNILKKIKLIDLEPVSIHDDLDDSKDCIWFYIKGKMIDYTINTTTNQKVSGQDKRIPFIEYWKFTRTTTNQWVLSKILQEDEKDKIPFQS